jgi:hypothetical protein
MIEGAARHLSPLQFGGEAVPDGLDGPLGSYGEPGQAVGYEGTGVRATAGMGI